MTRPDPIDDLLEQARCGDAVAQERLFEMVYGDLRARARILMGGGCEGTLQATALVHEAWLKLRSPSSQPRDRAHFMAIASTAMRSVLVDAARARGALKRSAKRVLLEEALEVFSTRVPDMLDLHDELERLAELDPRMARIVELRFFGGLSIDEVADTLELGRATVNRDWRMARAWLASRLEPGNADGHNHGD